MEKSWMPTTSGILSIVCGVTDLIISLAMLVMGTLVGSLGTWFPNMAQRQFPAFFTVIIITFMAALTLIVGVVALIGGIYALRKKVWGMALAGAIASCIAPFWPLGVGSLVFIILGRSEFK